MALLSLTAGFIFICGLILLFSSQKNKTLNKKIKELEKEVEIKSSTLNYEKTQALESTNYLHSITIIIMDLVTEISAALTREKEILEDDIYVVIFEKMKTLLKPKRCILFKINHKEGILMPAFSCGYKDEELKKLNIAIGEEGGLAGWSAAAGRFISFYDAEGDPALRRLADKIFFQAYYFQPIKVDAEVTALISVGKVEEKLPNFVFNRLFSIVSNIGSVALSNAILMQRLRQQSMRDGLTGLYNHSYFQKWLEDLLNKPAAEEKPFILAMLDLDNFKKINDTYGHPVGDIVLKFVAGLLNNLNVSDYICARYGGEEFILGFLGKERLEILSVMERFRQDTRGKVFKSNGSTFSVTLSIGIAESKLKIGKPLNRAELIDRVDKMLYKAKTTGKNKIVTEE